MADEKPVYTVETSKGNHSFTTDSLHTKYQKIEDFLHAHKDSIDLLRTGATIYGVYMTHHGKKTKL